MVFAFRGAAFTTSWYTSVQVGYIWSILTWYSEKKHKQNYQNIGPPPIPMCLWTDTLRRWSVHLLESPTTSPRCVFFFGGLKQLSVEWSSQVHVVGTTKNSIEVNWPRHLADFDLQHEIGRSGPVECVLIHGSRTVSSKQYNSKIEVYYTNIIYIEVIYLESHVSKSC